MVVRWEVVFYAFGATHLPCFVILTPGNVRGALERVRCLVQDERYLQLMEALERALAAGIELSSVLPMMRHL